MFTSLSAGKSMDSLSALSPGSRHEFPFHSRQGQRPRSRRSSTASSVQSIGGSLDTSTNSWSHSLHESGQNAISTLLQPPIVRTGLVPHSSAPVSSAHKPPTAKDIPPVALTNITQIDTAEFAPYLSQVGALYEQLRRVKESEEDASVQRQNGRQDEPQDSLGVQAHLRPGISPSRGRKGSTTSISSLNSIEAPSPIRRSSSSFTRKNTQGPAPLSTIPNVYFEEEFHLENPRTFDVASERSEVLRPANADSVDPADGNRSGTAPRKALATNAILQEKLSWYMDTIEVHLINSISTASTTFFTALGSLKELHSEASDSVQRIKALRTELAALDEEIVTRGLDIVQKRRRQENIQQLNDAVLQLRHIVDGVATCEGLVDTGEIDRALESIDGLEKLIAGERSSNDVEISKLRLRDLTGASALQGVHADLNTLRRRIGQAYEVQFTDILIRDLRNHTESVSLPDILLRWTNAASRAKGGHARSPSVFPTYLTQTDELKAQLFPSMFGLERAQHLSAAVMAHREAVLREIKHIIRRPLPSSSDDDNESMMSVSTASGGRGRSSQEKSSILARNLRALDHEDAEELLIKIYVGVTETLRRLTTQAKVLLDIASTLTQPTGGDGLRSPLARSPSRSPMTSPRPDRNAGSYLGSGFELQEELHKTLDINNLLGQTVDIAIEKIVKVLKVRSEQATGLPPDFFLRYFTLNLYFANECEAISGRSGTPLKTVVNSHIKEFVQKNREAEIQKLANGMKSDNWEAKDFTEKNSELLSDILASSTHDIDNWMSRIKIWVPYQEIQKAANGATSKTIETNGTAKEKSRPATIDSEKFVLPNSAIFCIEGIAKFLHLIMGMRSMTTEIASSLVAYLQMFNSLCTQLILGAGAIVSAGLKNITTKHLALASQSLSFISTIIPHVRECVRRHAGSGAGVSTLMGEFDKVRRLLQEHQDNIHQKLVDIMSGRALLHAKSMKAISWDESKSGVSAHPYMETLVKETSTLHRVLSKHLPDTSINMIMTPVFSSYKDHLGNALSEAEPKTQAGLDSMRRDMNYLKTKLGRIEGFANTDDFLEKIISGKDVESDEPPATTSEATGDTEEDKAKGGELKSEAASSDRPSENKDEGKAKAKDEEKDKKEQKKGT